VLFHSAYEAAASFLLGHRLSRRQARTLRTQLAQAYGRVVEVDGQMFHAFPEPAALLQVDRETWAPYRMWATVLLHVWIRGQGDRPPRTVAREPLASR